MRQRPPKQPAKSTAISTPRRVRRNGRGTVRDWRPGFLDALGQWGNIVRACQAVRLHRSTVHGAMKAEPAFQTACDEAITSAREHFEAELIRRVTEGAPVLYRGRPVKGVRQYGDKLLLELLRASWPEKWGRRTQHDVRLPIVEEMIRERKFTVEQLKAIAGGMPFGLVLAMAPTPPAVL